MRQIAILLLCWGTVFAEHPAFSQTLSDLPKATRVWTERNMRAGLSMETNDAGVIRLGAIDDTANTYLISSLSLFDRLYQDNQWVTVLTPKTCLHKISSGGRQSWVKSISVTNNATPKILTALPNGQLSFVQQKLDEAGHYHLEFMQLDPNLPDPWSQPTAAYTTTLDGPTEQFVSATAADGTYAIAAITTSITYNTKRVLVFFNTATSALIQSYQAPGQGDYYMGQICYDTQGNLILTAGTPDPVLKGNVTTIKYSPQGTPIWTKFYNATLTDNEYSTALTTDPSDRIYVAAVTEGFAGQTSTLLRYDSNGNELWVYTGDTLDVSSWSDLRADATGVYAVGRLANGNATKSAVARFTSQAERSWITTFATRSGANNGLRKIVYADGSKIQAVGLDEVATLGSCAYATELNSAGTLVWEKHQYGPTPLSDTFLAAKRQTSGTLIFASTENTYWEPVQNNTYTTATLKNGAVVTQINPNTLTRNTGPTLTLSPKNGTYIGWHYTTEGPKLGYNIIAQADDTIQGVEWIEIQAANDGNPVNYGDALLPPSAATATKIATLNNGGTVPGDYLTALEFPLTATTFAVDGQGELSLVTTTMKLHKPTPEITQQPESRTLPYGTNCTFTVVAQGIGTLKYQWYFNGSRLANATNSWLKVNNLGTEHNGPYIVRITDDIDTTQSLEARLTVIPVSDPLLGAWEYRWNILIGEQASLRAIAALETATLVLVERTPLTLSQPTVQLTWLDSNGNELQGWLAPGRTATVRAAADTTNALWFVVEQDAKEILYLANHTFVKPVWTNSLPPGFTPTQITATYDLQAFLAFTPDGASTPSLLRFQADPLGHVTMNQYPEENLPVGRLFLGTCGNKALLSIDNPPITTIAIADPSGITLLATNPITDGATTLGTVSQRNTGQNAWILYQNTRGIYTWNYALNQAYGPLATPAALQPQTTVVSPNGTLYLLSTAIGGTEATWFTIDPTSGTWKQGATLPTQSPWLLDTFGNNLVMADTEMRLTSGLDIHLELFASDLTSIWATSYSGSSDYQPDLPQLIRSAGSKGVYVGGAGRDLLGFDYLTLLFYRPNPRPIILSTSSPLTLGKAQSGTLSVEATGNQPLTCQWFKNGTLITGAVASTYTITTMSADQAGSYTARVANDYGATLSPAITVSYNPAPYIITQPQGTNDYPGKNVAMQVVAAGEAPLAYQWYKNGAAVSGQVADRLTFPAIQGNEGSYTVAVKNAAGQILSTPAVISTKVIAPPVVTGNITNQTVKLGTNVIWTATAVGEVMTTQWYRNGAPLSAATNATLSITNVGLADEGAYYFQAANYAGTNRSATGQLAILIVAPTLTTQPTGTNVPYLTTLNLKVVATGDLLTYQWRKNGTSLTGQTAPGLTLSNVPQTAAGDYTVSITNRTAAITSSVAVVTVTLTAPLLTLQPTNQTVPYKSAATLAADAKGYGTILFQWYFNNAVIPGATSKTFTIAAAQLTNSGSYKMEARNTIGSTFTTPITLTVSLNAPTITSLSPSLTTNLGATVVTSVKATGDLLTYQWSLNSFNLTGATNATNVFVLGPHTTGAYRVKISNAGGTLTSSAITITDNGRQITPQIRLLQTTPGLIQLQLTGVPEEYLTLEATEDLKQWSYIDTVLIGTKGTGQYPVPITATIRLFRATR